MPGAEAAEATLIDFQFLKAQMLVKFADGVERLGIGQNILEEQKFPPTDMTKVFAGDCAGGSIVEKCGGMGCVAQHAGSAACNGLLHKQGRGLQKGRRGLGARGTVTPRAHYQKGREVDVSSLIATDAGEDLRAGQPTVAMANVP